jgi:hypothetical protein
MLDILVLSGIAYLVYVTILGLILFGFVIGLVSGVFMKEEFPRLKEVVSWLKLEWECFKVSVRLRIEILKLVLRDVLESARGN